MGAGTCAEATETLLAEPASQRSAAAKAHKAISISAVPRKVMFVFPTVLPHCHQVRFNLKVTPLRSTTRIQPLNLPFASHNVSGFKPGCTRFDSLKSRKSKIEETVLRETSDAESAHYSTTLWRVSESGLVAA
jgi:hypothetical protein